jgi:capsular exopolysaccharide synthesis family protein
MQNLDPLDLPPPQEQPIASSGLGDFHKFLRTILDRSLLIISCIVLSVIGAALYVELTPKSYEATTTVQVEQEDAKVVKSEQVVSEDMRGLDIMNTVAQKMCNGALLLQVLESNGLMSADGSYPLDGSKLNREEYLKRFSRHVKASLRRNSRLIDINVSATNAALSARLANSLVENYLGEDALAQHTTTGNANEFLRKEAEDQKEKLTKAEQALQDYRKEAGSVSLEQNQDIVTPQLQDLNRRLTESKANLVEAEGDYKDSLKMTTNLDGLLAYTNVLSDPEVAQISQNLAKSEMDLVLVKQRYREKHPKYILAQASLRGLNDQLTATAERVRSRIQESMRIAFEKALTAQEGLESELMTAKTNAVQLGDVAVHYNVLSRDYESAKQQYDAIIQRLSETHVEAQLTPERIRVIQKALVPEKASSPKVLLAFAVDTFGGLIAGLVICFILEAANTTFRTVDEAEQFLALPVLGTVPKLIKGKSDARKLVAAEGSQSTGAEVFRTLRTTLSMLGPEKDRRTYLFTSSLPSEGKTFTSLNYAVSLAQQDLRTLLIDLDLRRPSVEQYFTGKRSTLPGVTDYFLGRKKFSEVCIQHEETHKFFWMPSGTNVPNPLELLTKVDFLQMINEGLSQFDRIVIDTAPLLPVSDTLLLASKVQTVVLVVQGCKTARKVVERSLQLLNKANAPIGGIVLNLMPNRRFTGYYYSYYHGYGYGHYGVKDQDAEKASVNA